MENRRLFRLGPEGYTVAAHWVPGEGWHCTIALRRGDEDWSEAYRAVYSFLSTAELVDVLDAEAARLL